LRSFLWLKFNNLRLARAACNSDKTTKTRTFVDRIIVSYAFFLFLYARVNMQLHIYIQNSLCQRWLMLVISFAIRLKHYFFFKMKTEIAVRGEPSNNENDISKIIRIRRKEARSYIVQYNRNTRLNYISLTFVLIHVLFRSSDLCMIQERNKSWSVMHAIRFCKTHCCLSAKYLEDF